MPYRVLALIMARSGSKGLRHKNVRELDGVPLLVRAVRLAFASQRKGEAWQIVVSTDSRKYASLAEEAGAAVPFLRPRKLARDDSRLIDAVLHALDNIEDAGGFDAVLLLSATTPLTTSRDVRKALALFRGGDGASVASVTTDPIPPSWRFELEEGRLDRRPRRHHVARRQEGAKDRVILNGAIYLATPRWLRRFSQFVRLGRTVALNMPPERSVDIECAEDLEQAQRLWRQAMI